MTVPGTEAPTSQPLTLDDIRRSLPPGETLVDELKDPNQAFLGNTTMIREVGDCVVRTAITPEVTRIERRREARMADLVARAIDTMAENHGSLDPKRLVEKLELNTIERSIRADDRGDTDPDLTDLNNQAADLLAVELMREVARHIPLARQSQSELMEKMRDPNVLTDEIKECIDKLSGRSLSYNMGDAASAGVLINSTFFQDAISKLAPASGFQDVFSVWRMTEKEWDVRRQVHDKLGTVPPKAEKQKTTEEQEAEFVYTAKYLLPYFTDIGIQTSTPKPGAKTGSRNATDYFAGHDILRLPNWCEKLFGEWLISEFALPLALAKNERGRLLRPFAGLMTPHIQGLVNEHGVDTAVTLLMQRVLPPLESEGTIITEYNQIGEILRRVIKKNMPKPPDTTP